MMLLTKKIRRSLPPRYSQEEVKDPIIRVKFFVPWGSWSWYAIEFDGEDQFFGLVDGFVKELGYFSLAELSALKGPLGLGVERDMHFPPTPLSKISPAHVRTDEESSAPESGLLETPGATVPD